MQLPTDNELFDLLDGVASDDLQQRHQQALITYRPYRTYFEQLRLLHEGLENLPLESPSMAFENKLMAQWQPTPTLISRRPSLKMPLIFVGIILTLTGMVLMGYLLMPHTATSFEYQFGFNNEIFQQLTIPFNVLLLLLILERVFAKQLKAMFFHNV
jgi:hypothetical protein